jgi:hypothetical protein
MQTLAYECKLWLLGNTLLWQMSSSGMLCHVAPVRTDVSEEPSASIIRVTRITDSCWFLQGSHGVTSQKTAFFIVTTVKSSNLKQVTTFTTMTLSSEYMGNYKLVFLLLYCTCYHLNVLPTSWLSLHSIQFVILFCSHSLTKYSKCKYVHNITVLYQNCCLFLYN